MLEIGAGDGRFLRTLERAGFRARGLDPHASGAGVEAAALDEVELPRAAFEGAVLWHVLEHLDDPAETLRRAGDALAPGGLLVVAVPNGGSLQARLGGERWFGLDLPRHAVLFTEEGLRALVGRCGYAVERVRHVAVDGSLLGMWQTLLNRLTREQDVAFRVLKRELPHRSRLSAGADLAVSGVAGAVLILPAVALELGAGLAGRGGSLVLSARKPSA